MAPSLSLIVGLGNPGPEYDQTRHNAGFWFVDALAAQLQAAWREDGRLPAETARASFQGSDLRLIKPMAYMNRSGLPVARFARFFKIEPARILVVHDELDLPPGVIRYKRGGGHGGHNGLRDLIRHLGTADFQRLRLGIGHPGHRDQVVDYVLQRPSREDRQAVETAIEAGLQVLPDLLSGKTDAAMRKLHGRKA